MWWVKREPSCSMIDGMMERLGEKGGLVVVGDQKGEMGFLPEPEEVNPKIPRVTRDLSLEVDRDAHCGFRSAMTIGGRD